jgi:hypothetical protein
MKSINELAQAIEVHSRWTSTGDLNQADAT